MYNQLFRYRFLDWIFGFLDFQSQIDQWQTYIIYENVVICNKAAKYKDRCAK